MPCVTVATQATPAPEANEYSDASDETRRATISHREWQELLDAYLTSHPSGINRFDYRVVACQPETQGAARFHYGVNCAGLGCPNLAPEAYRSDNLERLPEQGARDYVNHPRGVTVQGDRLLVSSIYEWFKVDFGGTDKGVFAHLKRYAAPELAKALDGYDRFDHDCDWSLNRPCGLRQGVANP